MKLCLNHQSLTLFELLIAIMLMGVVVLGFVSIELFSRQHTLISERRAQIHNDVTFALEHMTKEISKAIGDVSAGNLPVVIDDPNRMIKVYTDYNQNGKRDATGDFWISYRYRDNLAQPPSERYQFWYCPICSDSSCNTCSRTVAILSNKITAFTPTYNSSNNYVEVQFTACWDPDGTPFTCASPDNPTVTMRNRIKMPSVSSH